MEPYRSYFPHAGLLLSETNRLSQQVMILPTGTAVNEEDIDCVCHLTRFVVENAKDVNCLLVSHEKKGTAL